MPKAIHKNYAGFCFVIVVLHTIAHGTKCTLRWLSLFFKSPSNQKKRRNFRPVFKQKKGGTKISFRSLPAEDCTTANLFKRLTLLSFQSG